MSRHFERDMEELQRSVLSLSASAEEMVVRAIRALRERDPELARRVIAADHEIDLREVRIEEECLKMLALHQPVAIDLRRIATVLKINNELERMADLAVNISQRAVALCDHPEFYVPEAVDVMGERATSMVRRALDAFVEMNVQQAREVCAADDEVDELNRQVIDELLEVMGARSDKVSAALHCFSASRQLERIADHATNIAEDVIYLVDGEIARHRENPSATRNSAVL